MTQQRICLALLAVWAFFVALSVWRFATLAPTDFGMTRGLNRIEAFVGWQLAAIAVAVPVWLIGRGLPPGVLRWATRAPLLLALLLVLAIAAIIGWAWYIHAMNPPEAYVPPGPVTKPVAADAMDIPAPGD